MMTAFIIIAIITVLALIITVVVAYCNDVDVMMCSILTTMIGLIVLLVCGVLATYSNASSETNQINLGHYIVEDKVGDLKFIIKDHEGGDIKLIEVSPEEWLSYSIGDVYKKGGN